MVESDYSNSSFSTAIHSNSPSNRQTANNKQSTNQSQSTSSLSSSSQSPSSLPWHYREVDLNSLLMKSSIETADKQQVDRKSDENKTIQSNDNSTSPSHSHSPSSPASASASAAPSRSRSLFTEFLFGGLATCGACTFSHPLETIKVRMQLDGERTGMAAGNTKLVYRNPLHAFMLIARNEGIGGLYRGVLPAMAYQCCMNGSRLTLFGHVKRELCSIVYRTSEPQFNPPLAIQIVSGSISGIISSFLAMPLFLIKIRLQSQAVKDVSAVGVQHNYTGLASAVVSIVRTDGFTGLWTGVSASMLRVGIGSGVQLATYESSKRFLIDKFSLSDSWTSHLGASLLSGFGLTVAMNPADVVSSRMANQNGSMYSSLADCIRKTARNEGLGAFYKGFLAHYLRTGPHTMLTFMFWEQIKSFASKNGY